MPASEQVRWSVTLPAQVAKQVNGMAKRRRLSDNRVLVELIEEGIEAQKKKEKAFFELAERFRYDNADGYHHRHFMGEVENIEFESYEGLVSRFQSEVHELWRIEDEQES